jgi:hypothetical protein
MDKLHRYAKNFINFYFPDFDLRVRQSRENSADYEKNIIRLNLRDSEDYGFMRHLHEVHGFKLSDTLISPMMWTILHEVGHFATIDEIPPQDYDEAISTKTLLTLYGEEIKTNPTLQDRYFNTATEWEATEWAIEWVKSHFMDAYHATRAMQRLV